MTIKILTLILASIMFSKLRAQEDVIYGADNRFEVADYDDNQFIELAKSVALRVPNRRLSIDRENTDLFTFPQISLQQATPSLCPTERFLEQVPLGNCSGFLVASDKIMTAGHCMFSKSDCAGNKWVFGYQEGIDRIAKENTYSCKTIITQKYNYDSKIVADYAVIQLDRPVKNRKPLQLRKFGFPLYNTPLVLIGHPLGLPMKITDGARVTLPNNEERKNIFHSIRLRKNYFTANLDAYAGNSGSPVFNQRTRKVEGILVQGAEDYTENSKDECITSVHRTNAAKTSEEKIMRVTELPKF
jgi:V8-like Glu-specific endopeptidase